MAKPTRRGSRADRQLASEARAMTGRGDSKDGGGSFGGATMTGFDSFGITGLTRYGPVSRVYEEFLKELQGPQGMRLLREMRDNCAITGAILFAAEYLCRKVSFKFIPKDRSNAARRAADLCGSAVFDDMDSTWPETLSEILTMLPFGWALMEMRLKRRTGDGGSRVFTVPAIGDNRATDGTGYKANPVAPSRFDDGLIGFRSWDLRSQETLFMWEFDEDSKAIIMEQMAPPDYRIRRVPLTKCLHFRTQVSKNNPEGRSILRNAWLSYYMKKNLQIFEGIGVERDLAGYPMINIEKPELDKGLAVPDIWNPKDPAMVALLAALQKMVRSVRRDEQEGMVMPWWAKFSLVSTGSRRSFDTNAIIGRYDQRIAMTMMADFIMLGHEAVGSKALAATKISLFTAALSSFLDTACAIVDRHATPALMAYNNIPAELAPIMHHGDAESVNLQELGDFIAKIAGTGFNPLAGEDAQKAIMAMAKLPTTDMDGTVTPKSPGWADTRPGTVGDNADDEPDDHPPVDAVGTTTGAPSSLTTT